MSRFCPYCGFELPDEAKLCTQCGAVFSSDDQAEPEVPEIVQETASVVDVPVQHEEPVKAPKAKKFPKWLIPVAAVAAVLVAGAFLWQPIMKAVAPQSYVGLMMNNTNNALAERMEDTPAGILGNADYLADGSFAIDVDYSDEENGNINANVTLQSNTDDQKWLLDAAATVMETKVDFSAYMDSNVFAVGSKALTDGKYYGLTYSTFADDLKASAFGEMLEPEMVDMMTSVVDTVDSTIELTANMEERLKPYVELLSAYIKELECENGSAKIELDGKEKNCSTVAFNIEQDELFDLLSDMIDLLNDEPEFKDLISMFVVANGDEDVDVKEMMKDALKEVESAINAEAVLTYYVYNSKVVDINMTLELEMEEEGKVEMEMDVCYGANPEKSDIVVSCTTKVDDQKVTAKVVTSDSWDGDVYTCESKMTVKSDGETMAKLDQKIKWNKESGKLTISTEVDEMEISFSMKLIETKNGCELSIDDLYEFMNDVSEGSMEYVDPFDCSIKLTFSEGASISTPSFTNLDKLDQTTVEGILEDVNTFVSENAELFEQFGSTVEPDYNYDYDYEFDDEYIYDEDYDY